MSFGVQKAIVLTKEELKDLESFCALNGLDIDTLIKDSFKQGYRIEKYGLLGNMGGIQEKWVEKEVIREKRVEIPVEVIKEVVKIEYVEVPVEKIVTKEVTVEKLVEVIKEVPIERVVEKIVEVPVEKIVTNIEYIRDQKIENELFGKIEQLENETAKKNEELDELSQTLDELRQKLDIKEDNDKVKLLQQTLQNLRGELQQKNEQIKELEKINRDLLNGNQNQAYLLRGSNLNKRV